MRRAIVLERDRLAVEDDLTRRDRTRGLDDLRHCDGHIAQAARVHPHVVAGFVHLDARAIEFVFERRLAELVQSLVEVGGRPGQHRPNRLKRPHDERVKRAVASAHRRRRHWRERPGEHGRPPETGRRDIPGTRRGLEQHRFERALAQLAVQEPDEKVLLVPCGPPQQIAQDSGFRGRRSRPGMGRDAFEGGIDVAEVERGSLGRCRRARLVDGSATNPDPSLTRGAAQIGNRDLELGCGNGPEQCRETIDLLKTAA